MDIRVRDIIKDNSILIPSKDYDKKKTKTFNINANF